MRHWFKVACMIILSFFVIGNFQQDVQASSKSTTYYVAKTANLYNGTSSKKKQIDVVDINNKLTTKTSKYSKMYEVTYKGKKGYVYASRLSTKPVTVTKYVDEKSNLYDKTKKKKIATLEINTKVTTTSPLSDKMVEVTYKGKKGYIYISRLSSKPVPVTYFITEKTNLYDSSKKKKIANLEINAKVTTASLLSDKMVEVTYNGKKGYVYTNRLATKGKQFTVYASKLDSSKAPVSVPVYGKNNVLLAQVPTNTKLVTTSVLSEKTYEVLYNGQIAYVRSSDTSAKPYSNNNSYGISHITQYQMEQIVQQQNSEEFKVPAFDGTKIRNIPSAKGYDKFGNLINLDVWDTWPLQDGNGQVATYNGYNIVFGLAGNPIDSEDTFVYMFYQKAGETSLDSWKNAGRVFGDSDKFVPNDPYLKYQTQEWSGSATLTSDGKIRLFYTDFSGSPEDGGTGYSKQTLTTAQINVSQPDNETIKIEGVEDHKSIFDGDGKIYQNVQQFINEGAFSTKDNHTLRDPHYIEENGRKFLVFEGNTGTETGYHGDNSLYNKAYYGGDDNYYIETQAKLFNNGKKKIASLANGAIGIIEINDDYTLKKVMQPLIASNTVTDEIERANVFELNGKWYLFTSSRGSKMAVDGVTNNDIYMLGYVSDSLTGEFKPLNGTGLVLYMNLPKDDVTFTYAHYAIPQKEGNNVVITSYMTNRGQFINRRSTFAPSFLVNIQGSTSSVVKNNILEQGQITLEEGTSSYTK